MNEKSLVVNGSHALNRKDHYANVISNTQHIQLGMQEVVLVMMMVIPHPHPTDDDGRMGWWK